MIHISKIIGGGVEIDTAQTQNGQQSTITKIYLPRCGYRTPKQPVLREGGGLPACWNEANDGTDDFLQRRNIQVDARYTAISQTYASGRWTINTSYPNPPSQGGWLEQEIYMTALCIPNSATGMDFALDVNPDVNTEWYAETIVSFKLESPQGGTLNSWSYTIGVGTPGAGSGGYPSSDLIDDTHKLLVNVTSVAAAIPIPYYATHFSVGARGRFLSTPQGSPTMTFKFIDSGIAYTRFR